MLRDNEADGILSSKLLLKRLLMLERAVQQNAYHRCRTSQYDMMQLNSLFHLVPCNMMQNNVI